MSNKKLLILVLSFVLFFGQNKAQNDIYTLKAHVFDKETEQPLPFVNVSIQALAIGTITDDKGSFVINNLKSGPIQIILYHLGHQTQKVSLNIRQDTSINIYMLSSVTSLSTVDIKSKRNDFNNQSELKLKRDHIEENTNLNLSELIENEAGVSSIKTGSGIAKPIVHGLYGNRITILNNGIIQSGQQWGNDHSPEIDPFASDNIHVLKGANAIEYGSGNLGSAILLEPGRIPQKKGLHGQVNYAFESNGRGHNLNTRIEQHSNTIAWRINASAKKYGDRKTPTYYLNNSGVEEANLSLQLEKSWKNRWFMDVYASTFNTRIGILRGAHIGNLTDLEAALNNNTPFFTEPDFSYDIDAPRQEVSHHLVKIKTKYLNSEKQILELVLAGQMNQRKEFDVRRSGRTDIPALSLLQYTFNAELKYTHILKNHWKLKLGNQNILTDNTNQPETGILPLIPDYISWKSGLFSVLSKELDKSQINFGLRYDFEQQKVVSISNSYSKSIIRYENNFHNLGGLFSYKKDWSKTQSTSYSLGYAMRNPSINELYSNGLHQGISGIEEGDIHLNTEKALKNTLEHTWTPNPKFVFNALVYHQYFLDYIYLNPQDEMRLTIRGAFPVFKYEQTNANIYGLDVSAQLTFWSNFSGVIKYSYLKGEDITHQKPLIFMPSNSLYASLSYQVPQTLRFSKGVKLEDSKIELHNKLVFEQSHLEDNQDFAPAPPTYNLLGAKASGTLVVAKYKIKCFVRADNILNVQYRDYLNRQRYFADDLGLSITIGVNLKF